MEGLYDEGRINQSDVHSVYESLFLRAVTGFEVFLERQFFAILTGAASYPNRRGVSTRMTPATTKALKDILLQGKSYLDWIPIQRTIDRADIYLKNGRPFSDISAAERSSIAAITTIRHAIAHRSPHAEKKFRDHVIGSQVLLPVEKRPAGYLRSQTNSGQRRFEVFAITLGRIALGLT
jgi:hypothetical protein